MAAEIIELAIPTRKSFHENITQTPDITFKVIRNNGSPYNCLYASILQSPYVLREQEKTLKNYKFTCMDLKHIIREFANDQWEEFKDNLFAQHRNEVPLFKTPETSTDPQLREAYKNFISKYDTLGTVTELTILSRKYKFNFIVLQQIISKGKIFYAVIDQSRNSDYGNWLYLRFTGNINAGHWELLEPVGNSRANFIEIPDDVYFYFNGLRQLDLEKQSCTIGSMQVGLPKQSYKIHSYLAGEKQLKDPHKTISSIEKFVETKESLAKCQAILQQKIQLENGIAKKNAVINKHIGIDALKKKRRYEKRLQELDRICSKIEVEGLHCHQNMDLNKLNDIAEKEGILDTTSILNDIDNEEKDDDDEEEFDFEKELKKLEEPLGFRVFKQFHNIIH